MSALVAGLSVLAEGLCLRDAQTAVALSGRATRRLLDRLADRVQVRAHLRKGWWYLPEDAPHDAGPSRLISLATRAELAPLRKRYERPVLKPLGTLDELRAAAQSASPRASGGVR